MFMGQENIFVIDSKTFVMYENSLQNIPNCFNFAANITSIQNRIKLSLLTTQKYEKA